MAGGAVDERRRVWRRGRHRGRHDWRVAWRFSLPHSRHVRRRWVARQFDRRGDWCRRPFISVAPDQESLVQVNHL